MAEGSRMRAMDESTCPGFAVGLGRWFERAERCLAPRTVSRPCAPDDY